MSDASNTSSECVICLDPLKPDDLSLSCCHRFHKTCLQDYQEYSNSHTCPVCDREIENLFINPITKTHYICSSLIMLFCVLGLGCTLRYILID